MTTTLKVVALTSAETSGLQDATRDVLQKQRELSDAQRKLSNLEHEVKHRYFARYLLGEKEVDIDVLCEHVVEYSQAQACGCDDEAEG